MFSPGDHIVHQRHGAGVVQGFKNFCLDGVDREYLCIRIERDDYDLMVPIDTLDEEEIRPALTDTSIIEKVMLQNPEELDENYRARQATIRKMLRTRNPRRLAAALRDLTWHEYREHLTNTDKQLRNELLQALADEMALLPRLTLAKAKDRLRRWMDAMENRYSEDTAVTSSA
jgi:RNA polymerase-interacting CarD/CdnL/TRCF family regulator